MEALGIAPVELLKDDEEALRQVNEGIHHDGTRYVVPFPKRPCIDELPDNFRLARGRFEVLRMKLEGEPELFEKYNAIIQDQLNKGVIEYVTSDSPEGSLRHYIPHRAHVTPLKATTKVRIVYNASARSKGARSLNESLLRGPVGLADLVGMLIRFRFYPIAIICDVEKAFLQVGITEADRDLTRFLWFEGSKLPGVGQPTQTVTLRFTRVPFGIVSSPFLLDRAIDYHLEQFGTRAAQDIQRNKYVDNFIVGRATVKEAVDFYEESKEISEQAAMNLREYTSNSKEFLAQIPLEDSCHDQVVKVLGLIWDTVGDSMSLSVPETITRPMTKRTVLQALHRIYDPCGFALPVTIVWRLLLQQTWEETGHDWDVELSPELQKAWTVLEHSLVALSKLQISRFIGVDLPTSRHEIVAFCDASARAYASVIYLRSVGAAGVVVTLLFSKGRVAPKDKVISIPRLELLANLIMVRAVHFLIGEVYIPIAQVTVSTDSQCVLHWLRSQRKLSVFVGNRVREINQYTAKHALEYLYVSTDDNPADIPTKGITATELLDNPRWFHGPDWLGGARDQWPVQPLPSPNPAVQCDIEAEECLGDYTVSLLHAVEEDANTVHGVDATRFSTLTKLEGTFAYVLRFIRHCKSRIEKKKANAAYVEEVVDKLLAAGERQEAREALVKEVQRVGLPEVIQALNDGVKNSIVQQLRVYVDNNGILRCIGRIDNALQLDENAKRPILLPKNHMFTKLLVMQIHKVLMHSGVSHTLSILRRHYWITQARTFVKQVLHRCGRCRRVKGPPYGVGQFPQLPESRVSCSPVFTHTGIDFFGPVYIRTSEGRSRCDVLLLTCMATRAVHLELVDSMATEDLLLALRRFFANRGVPRRIVSDNAKSFKLANEVLDETWSDVLYDNTVQDDLARRGIKWEFITDLAPWCGGFYERLVGVVKMALRKSLGRELLSRTELATVLEETAAIVNSRPLIYCYDEVDGPVLTPSVFLTGNPKPHCAVPELPDEEYPNPQPSSADLIRARWKRTEVCLSQFWKTFTDCYVLSLRERYQTRLKQARSLYALEPRAGDVVLVKENLQPRATWRVGVVEEVRRSSDGITRTATVRVPNGNVLLRSITHLYPLEAEEPQERPQQQADLWDCPICRIAWCATGPNMIGCDGCDRWFHWSCVGLLNEPDSASWFCDECNQ